MDMKRMVVWWLIVCVQLAIYLALAHFGIFSFVWVNDFSKLSILNMILNWVGTLLIGRWTYLKSKGKNINETDGWFFSEVPFKIGMLGTVIGFTGMVAFTLGAISGVGGITPIVMQKLVTILCQQLGTALLPTGAGLFANLSLTIQMNNLEGMPKKEDV
jgi:hypothetical protein